jgi:hypothetical protein
VKKNLYRERFHEESILAHKDVFDAKREKKEFLIDSSSFFIGVEMLTTEAIS